MIKKYYLINFFQNYFRHLVEKVILYSTKQLKMLLRINVFAISIAKALKVI